MKHLSIGILLLLQLFAAPLIWANNHSPVGTWITIDDKTNKPRSEIRIWESQGKLYGKVIKVFKQAGDTGICKKCPGAFKNKPIQGMTILWDLKSTGKNTWSGGEILDPKSGKIYRLKMNLSQNGQTLDVRGYIGISLLGRTQVWNRK